MKKLFLGIVAFLPLCIFAQKQIINDENVQVRSVGPFNAIKVSDAIDIFLSQSEKEAMAVSAAKEEYRDRIRTSVENGILRIWLDRQGRSFRNTNMKLRVYLSFTTLNRIEASGASDVVVSGTIKTNELAIDMSGASDFKGNVEANTFTVDLAGASDATVSGKVTSLKIVAGGASDFKGYDLETDTCNVDAGGASDIRVRVNKELNARASGASGVYYKGEGVTKEVKTSGSSSVSRRG